VGTTIHADCSGQLVMGTHLIHDGRGEDKIAYST
jgi:hypothetical protein